MAISHLLSASLIIVFSQQVLGQSDLKTDPNNNYNSVVSGEVYNPSEVYNPDLDYASYPALLFLGNSTMVPVYNLFIADQEPYVCTNISVSGHKINQQLSAWNALTVQQKQSFDYVLVQIGLNDLNGSTFISDFQILISKIKTDKKASCKIIAATESPARVEFNYTNWRALNAAIRGEGTTPISGIDYVMTTNTTKLDLNGDGYLDGPYDIGDGVHPNNAGRLIIKNNYLDLLRTLAGTTPVTPPGVTNLARNKPAAQSSTTYGGDPKKAVDGNTDGIFNNGSVTHTLTDQNAWWEVDLGASYTINTIELWNRTNGCCIARLSNFHIFVSDVPFQSRQLNATLNQPGIWHVLTPDYPNPQKIFTVNNRGRYIRVQLAGTGELSIAEVVVMGSSQNSPPPTGLINLATNKPAKQSSTAYGGAPGRAVDGNTNGLWEKSSVTHTFSEQNAWWEVDLGGIYTINTIELWNRTNACCTARFSNFHLFVSDVPFQSTQLNATLNQSGSWHVLTPDYPNPQKTFAVNRTGRYIRVQLAGTGELSIAELKAMGSATSLSLKSTEESPVLPDIEPLQILIYPVPFSDVIHINSNQAMNKIVMLNALGQEFLFVKCQDVSAEINTSSFKPGYYFIRVTSEDNQVETYPVIKSDW